LYPSSSLLLGILRDEPKKKLDRYLQTRTLEMHDEGITVEYKNKTYQFIEGLHLTSRRCASQSG
jgi:hypothetical protein